MPTTVSVRLDPQTEAILARLAERRSQTKSEVLREALVLLARTEADEPKESRPYEALVHLIGSVRGGPPDLSVRTGQKLRDMLGARAKRRDGPR